LNNASSSEGYKHTDAAKQKMVKRLEDKSNHPWCFFFTDLGGKHRYGNAKSLISKPSILNPMFGKTHSEKLQIFFFFLRNNKVKYSNGVGIYDLDNNIVKSFDYASYLAIYLNVSKVTVSKYIKNGLVFKGKYYLKVNPFNE
jgi:group I intron endonuclease